ncbi:hypothetical protein ACOYR1_10190 [Thalassotalea piscium]
MISTSSLHYQAKSIKQMWQILATCLVFLIMVTMSFVANSTEFSINAHQGDESDIKGFSFHVADKFSKKNNFYWQIGYSNYQDLSVEWNKDKLFFDISNVEAIVSYRHKLKSYNKFINNLTLEYQLGVAVVMTENKFNWPELNEEKFFSEKGDINPLMGVALHYNFSRNNAFVFGVKYQPEVSEFGDMSSFYIGFIHRFNQRGY